MTEMQPGMRLREVLGVVEDLIRSGCVVWVAGGWGIDALVGRRTRDHRDLDLAIDARHEAAAIDLLEHRGYAIQTDWRPVRVELTAAGRGWVDLHPVVFDGAGHGRQADLAGGHFDYPLDAFDLGSLDGVRVPCISREQQIRFHAGYPPRPVDVLDIQRLAGLPHRGPIQRLPHNEASPEDLAHDIVGGLIAQLSGQVQSVIAHGSWVDGDFCPGRSDLDLVVVLHNEPGPGFTPRVQIVLDQIVDANPQWADRLELGFVTSRTIQGVLDGDETTRQVGRVSPGEPLHFPTADRHRLLDWDAAYHGKSVYGAAPTNTIPPIPASAVRDVVIEHLRSWPSWLAESDSTGYQAYATLTVSRAAAYLATGRRVSKREGAAWAAAEFPVWRDLLKWATEWWYAGGSGDDAPPDDVPRFVSGLAASQELGWRSKTCAGPKPVNPF